MTVADVWKVCAAVVASLGGGGLILLGLSSYIGKVWAERGLQKQRHEYATLIEASKHEFDLATRRIQIELDTLGHLHKLRTSEESESVKELWKRLSMLGVALVRLPSLGFRFVNADREQAEKSEETARNQFFTRYEEARDFLIAEAFSIPKNIKDPADAALKIATEQIFDMLRARSTFQIRDDAETTSNNQTKYQEKLDEILDLMRKFKAGNPQEDKNGGEAFIGSAS
jgi:hypothetical protein